MSQFNHMDVCVVCKGTSAKSSCSKCKQISYCNRQCQVAHWKYHKKSCGLPSLTPNISKMIQNDDLISIQNVLNNKTIDIHSVVVVKGEASCLIHIAAVLNATKIMAYLLENSNNNTNSTTTNTTLEYYY